MSVPAWLQTLRSLRPANVIQALPDGHELLLLNPRDLRRVEAAPIARITAPALFLVPALLRAARDANALVGLGMPRGEEVTVLGARQFARAVLEAATELGYGAPTFMATPPLPLGAPVNGDRLRDAIQRFIDSGFTEIVLECPQAPPEGLAGVLEVGLSAVRERELSLAVAAADADQAAPILDELARVGCEPDLVALGSPSGAGALAAGGIELPIDALRPGVRGVDISPHIAVIAGAVTDSADEPSRMRAEALVYADAFGILSGEPFRGAAARAMRALAENPGY